MNLIIDAVSGIIVDPRTISLITIKNWECIDQDEIEENAEEEKRIRQLKLKHLMAPMYDEYGYNLIFYGMVTLYSILIKRKTVSKSSRKVLNLISVC